MMSKTIYDFKAEHMRKACQIFASLPIEEISRKIEFSKTENKKYCMLYKIQIRTLSDHNITKYVINMLREYYNCDKICHSCNKDDKTSIHIIFKNS